MDTTITRIGAVVIAELRSVGYMESTIGQYGKTIKALTEYAKRHGANAYTPALGAGFASMTTSPRTGRFSAQRRFDYRRLVALFDSYVTTGRVDLSMRRRGGGGPRPTSAQFVVLNDSWESDMAERGLAAATREAYGRTARGYLCFLESRGTVELDDADGGTVLEFLRSLSPRWAKTTLFWVVSNLRPFLTFINRADLIDAVNLAGVKRPHPIVPVLGDDDHRRIIAACTSGIVCVRDAAITLLALSTGLRACDIIALRLGDIDWQGQTISLVQQKTGNPLTVPLIDVLTSTLADYVVHERPETEDDHLFVRRVAPHVRLRDHASIHRVTATVFTAAEVTDVKGGTRLLRHNAASRMLRAATPLPTIAAVLGLASEESAKQYMNIDDERLLRCVLAVPQSARP
ncbi:MULTISPECIES: tyrosine-type recombinase/integrase [unclassified Rhodococcus (in: high G+C Gram-positive bacteria)]|uniref:tyrosine-type recombinase/integrase n=1 Tax=unclassified Rhodococcus (in: high G+C Gram-positive bacteria) TaxID=192944 RepID=UPI00077AEA33|nr:MULTISPECIES: tyrosine-type recombinase/integrase [unclassified Rhodococcus (in: high G+C Gram-positive bacteria)]KXX56814.1 integrase [Rhodococcus sp. LB1]MDI9939181.1 tyrosine-type recombinase/integrase [Rhodococcus sp. IEGM 1351]